MIIYKNSINGFIDDCDKDEISQILLFQLKSKRGVSIGVSDKEYKSFSTLKKVANILRNIENKSKQYILLEFVIRDSMKRIDLIILGTDEKNEKNMAIIELKGWSKISLYKDTLLLKCNTQYVYCNHPSKEAYDYMFILNNMYSDVNDFNMFCYSYLPNYEYKTKNVLKSKRFDEIISLCDSYCKTNNIQFINTLKSHFVNSICQKEIDKFDDLTYKPKKEFLEHIKDECNDIRLIGSQSITYEIFTQKILDYRNKNKKIIFLISGSAGSGKTIVAFKMMTFLRSIGEKTFLVLPGPEFREAIKKSYNNKTSSKFIRGVDGFLESDSIIIDEAHKATGRDNANIYYNRLFDNTKKSIVAFIDNQQVVNKKGITKNELKNLAINKGWECVELNLFEQFRNGGDVSYVDWLKKIIFNDDVDNNQEYFVNNFFDFRILSEKEFNLKYIEKYNNSNSRMVSFWTQTWDLNGLIPTVKIGNSKYIWNPNWQWLSKYKSNGNKSNKDLEKLCNTLNFNKDKKGYQYIGYFNTVQGYEFDYIFVHIPKLFYLNEKNEVDVDFSKLCMREMKSQIWSLNNVKDLEEKLKKEKLNKLYFLNRLFINLTRGKKGAYVYIEDEKLEKYFKDKFIFRKDFN